MPVQPVKLAALFLPALLALLPQTLMAEEIAIARSPFTIGESVAFTSRILQEERILNVYLPRGYEENTDRRYPVVYLLDGSADEDFIHIAGLAQFAAFPWIEMAPEVIVVGIANVDRKRDFTSPTEVQKDKEELPTSGGSARFMDVLDKEILPIVDLAYRTKGSKTLIGQSLGGLLATEILFKRPGLFDHYMIVSPSLWWNQESILKTEPAEIPKSTKVFIAVGREGEVMERTAKELHDKLAAKGSHDGRLWFRHFPELGHGDTLHLAVYAAFQKVFEKRSTTNPASRPQRISDTDEQR